MQRLSLLLAQSPRHRRFLQLVRQLAALSLAVCAAACSGDDDPDPRCFIGDETQPATVELVYRSVDGRLETASSGGEVPLVQPPQGGKVLLVSARATNVPCLVQLTAFITDPCTDRILALEQRPVTLVDRGDGVAEPDTPMELNNYANLPACPAATAERDVEAEPYVVTVRIEEPGQRLGEVSLDVVPVCAEAELEDQCKCECDANYVLGQVCDPEIDGGPPPGSCAPDGGL